MPNWCATRIRITGKEQDLRDLQTKLESWTKPNHENGFGEWWLGNLVLNSGVGTVDQNKESDLTCRGSVENVMMKDGDLWIETTTAYIPMMEIWQKILAAHAPNVELYYTAIEPACGVFWTNEPDTLGGYYFEPYDIDAPDLDLEVEDVISREDLSEILRKLLKTDETNFHALLGQMEQKFKGQYQIEEWTYVPA